MVSKTDIETEITNRPAEEPDFQGILRLNEVEERQTSRMDLQKLRLLDQLSSYHRVAIVDGQVAAFLLTISAGAAYQSDNYSWFDERFPDFLYVDRIVVGKQYSRLGLASRLYSDMFDYARSHGIRRVTCEYNIEPPNPASRAFHEKFGFTELDTQWVANGTKRVSMQVAEVR